MNDEFDGPDSRSEDDEMIIEDSDPDFDASCVWNASHTEAVVGSGQDSDSDQFERTVVRRFPAPSQEFEAVPSASPSPDLPPPIIPPNVERNLPLSSADASFSEANVKSGSAFEFDEAQNVPVPVAEKQNKPAVASKALRAELPKEKTGKARLPSRAIHQEMVNLLGEEGLGCIYAKKRYGKRVVLWAPLEPVEENVQSLFYLQYAEGEKDAVASAVRLANLHICCLMFSCLRLLMHVLLLIYFIY